MKKILISILSIILFMSCGDTVPVHANPVTEDEKSETEESDKNTDDDDGTPHPVGVLNYATIAEHPRLFFSKESENKLKAILATDESLLKIHNYIISYSDNTILPAKPVERNLGNDGMLSISRTFMGRMFYLAYAWRMTGHTKYLLRAEQELEAVSSFLDWNPEHFLNAGEISLGIAVGYDWLYYDLSPELKTTIRIALNKFAIQPSNDNSRNWWLADNGNWNQVCNGGIGCAAIATYEGHKEIASLFLERAIVSSIAPLEGYAPDGNYQEGYGYWHYGTTYQVLFLAALESAFGSDNDLHKSRGFLKTAEYILYMVGPSDLCFNYADCGEKVAVPSPVNFWLAKKAGEPAWLFNEARLLKEGKYIHNSTNKYLPFMLANAADIDVKNIPVPAKKIWVGQGITPVAFVRTGWTNPDKDLYVGIKAGQASTNHGHMDAGSFVYDADGIRWAQDLGWQSYSTLQIFPELKDDLFKMNQSSLRWSVFRLNNEGHNNLTINDNPHNVSGKAEIVQIYDTDEKRGVKIDMANVFSTDLSEASRTICIINEEYLQIEDELRPLKANTKIRWQMLTEATPEIITENTIKLTQNGKEKYLIVDSGMAVNMQTWSAQPTTEYDAANPGITIVGFDVIIPTVSTQKFIVKLAGRQ